MNVGSAGKGAEVIEHWPAQAFTFLLPVVNGPVLHRRMCNPDAVADFEVPAALLDQKMPIFGKLNRFTLRYRSHRAF
ncbi:MULTISPECIES: hypothetical protein [unclassified Pseudomonas]|uniref:hypothetical protein n=1 Tax=unclassified Pseudomonas TaxID=196821 RepID=UPI0011B65E7C|nr:MULTISPECIES: hypothetical protein [unclassified Pseudomonas]